MVTLALAQLRCEKAAVAENLAAIARVYRQADQQGASVVACPEMSLTGYIDPTRQPEAILRLDDPEVAALNAITAEGKASLLAALVRWLNGKGIMSFQSITAGVLKTYVIDVMATSVERCAFGWDSRT